MKVILLDYVYKHGVAGEVIDVADGFARNFLIPRGLAAKATEGELRRAKTLRDQAAAKRAQLEQRLAEVAAIIDGVELIFGRRAAATGKLFGSVTTQEIADELLKKTGVDINRRRISQQGLREIGTHMVPVRMGTENSPVLRVVIVREDELQQYLAARAAEAAGEQAGEQTEEGIADTLAEVTPGDLPTEVLAQDAVMAQVEERRQAEAEADTTNS
ncbi:MAG: 50S ribosomal protein L9 [bacterium]|nr:50S ribosomal protein L9 [bacterium]